MPPTPQQELIRENSSLKKRLDRDERRIKALGNDIDNAKRQKVTPECLLSLSLTHAWIYLSYATRTHPTPG